MESRLEPPEPWELLADVLLQREAALCRIVTGVPPRDFAGLYVGDDQLDTLLRSLPGLDGPAPVEVKPVIDTFAPLIESARAALAEWLDAARGAAMADCVRRARLSVEEAEILGLLAAVELHPARQRLVAYVQDSVHLPRLTLAGLARVLGPVHAAERALAPSSALSRAELVVVESSGPWAVRMCGIAPRLAWALRGDDSADPDLPPGSRMVPAPARGTPSRLRAGSGPVLAVVHGGDRDSRLGLAAALHSTLGAVVCPVPTSQAQWAALVREAGVTGRAVVVELSGPPPVEALARVESATHVPWVWCSAHELPLDLLPRCRWHEFRVDDSEATAAEWVDALGRPPPVGMRLTREQLRLAAAACGGDSAALADGVRRLAGGHLDAMALRIRPQRSWEDLVLPEDQLRQLHDIAVRHRFRGRVFDDWHFQRRPSTGVVALFAGPSGTGKTLAAEVVAAELELDLYKVELSGVVSKWVGETEKNLDRIFDAAQACELVLFFDEADALFGKRSDVGDARDRYANIEVAYLLQRLERYEGLVVMATNLQHNIDPAFMRRVSVAVEFSAPDESQRRLIWQNAFPPAAPVEKLDLDLLARQFKVTGAVIHDAALAAAFIAAEADASITMECVVLALAREYQKLGRLRTEAEFGRYHRMATGHPAG